MNKNRKRTGTDNTTTPEAVRKKKLPAWMIEKYQYMNNTKIAREILTQKIVSGEVTQLPVTIKENVVNLVDIWTDENLTLSRPVTPFDMAVMDAVYTIYHSGVLVVTAEWVIKVLSGDMSIRPTEKKLKMVRESIEKLMCIHIKIDCKEEINSRKDTKDKVNKYVYESYLLPLDKTEAEYESNGKEVIAYGVLGKPALYDYAELVHQIIDVPSEFFITDKESFNETEAATLIKRYVIKRVAQIVNHNRLNSQKISYLWFDSQGGEQTPRGLYAELGFDYESDTEYWRKKTKPMITKIVKATLQQLTDKGLIKGYEPYKDPSVNGQKSPIMGFKIFTKDLKTTTEDNIEVESPDAGWILTAEELEDIDQAYDFI